MPTQCNTKSLEVVGSEHPRMAPFLDSGSMTFHRPSPCYTRPPGTVVPDSLPLG